MRLPIIYICPKNYEKLLMTNLKHCKEGTEQYNDSVCIDLRREHPEWWWVYIVSHVFPRIFWLALLPFWIKKIYKPRLSQTVKFSQLYNQSRKKYTLFMRTKKFLMFLNMIHIFSLFPPFFPLTGSQFCSLSSSGMMTAQSVIIRIDWTSVWKLKKIWWINALSSIRISNFIKRIRGSIWFMIWKLKRRNTITQVGIFPPAFHFSPDDRKIFFFT